MKFEAVTIKDIARALGLSTSTVSRALRDSYEISPETKKLVLDYAEKIKYHPNPIALSLKERRSRSIGVIVSEIANSFFSQAIHGIDSVAYKNGYNVIIAQSRESFEREMQQLSLLTSRSVDGLLISVSTETKDFSALAELNQKGLPIVFFDRVVDEIDTHKVIVDNFKGAYDATMHLLENGCRHVAAIAIAPVLSITKERVAGYEAALAEKGIEPAPGMIRYCQHGGMITVELEDVLKQLLDNDPKPDAILALSDKLTTGTLRYFKKNQIDVPGTIGLIGFSNNDLTELFDPALSVIVQPAFEMGELAITQLLQLIESKRPVTSFEKIILSTELLIRHSTRQLQKTETNKLR
jgi:DNA-binding LacI/PurR family transcriptional regulator